jgi:hypothetical protein
LQAGERGLRVAPAAPGVVTLREELPGRFPDRLIDEERGRSQPKRHAKFSRVARTAISPRATTRKFRDRKMSSKRVSNGSNNSRFHKGQSRASRERRSGVNLTHAFLSGIAKLPFEHGDASQRRLM